MVEFQTMYYHPMDRQVHTAGDELNSGKQLEDPIIPIGELGITVSEKASERKGGLIQGVQAAFRAGVGKIQLMMDLAESGSAIGGPKGYGKEVREKLREVILANEGVVTGVELPTSLTNLNGGVNLHDPENGGFSESLRQKELHEVKEHIKFVGDVLNGGEVDIVSWEYPRTVFDAPWNDEGKWKGAFNVQAEKKDFTPIQFVDSRTGRIQQFSRKGIPAPIKAEEPEKGILWDFEKFQDYAKNKGTNVYDEIKNSILQRQIHFSEEKENEARFEILQLENRKKEIEVDLRLKEEDKKKYFEQIDRLKKSKEIVIKEQERIKAQHEEQISALEPMKEFAKEKTVQSYAEAGIYAMMESEKPNIKKPIVVGPELGWPHSYGGHPQEFKEVIQKSRKKMVEILTSDKITDSTTGKVIDNPHKMSKDEAEEQAKMHIKGTFDTSHVGMWLQNFRPDLPEEKRLKEFNKWYLEQVKDLAKTDLVGTIQLVDSNGPGHGHLPPGEGIFPVVEAAKEFKKQGFTGHFVSEGHEEEKFGEGRIFSRTWERFGAPISAGGYPSPPTWGEIHNAYFGKTYPPLQMFGSYKPPTAEYRPWAGGKDPIPFE
ncbi:hypothetical protein HYV79_05415 [Candidatus Woesearchaeota archaeon]|nr:hypothetical protein [Candidatus Woesearchaeota archaeon]